MFEALFQAWAVVFSLTNMAYLCAGVGLGLMLGAIPGLGGVIGLTLLLPFVFDMAPVPALAMIIGMAAVVSTSDSIPAILFGIPGTVSAQATILDGYPMARRGEAARALGASFSASAIGGLFGAMVLFASIPILRPLVLQFRSPEFFMLAMLGISMVAVLSRGAMAKGLAAGGLGLLLTTVGQDPLSGTFRYVYDTAYLWEGLPIVAVALGIFAIPELVDMVRSGGAIASAEAGSPDTLLARTREKWKGVGDTLRNWFGVLRSSGLGVFVGVIPGLGGSVVDWFAYGVAKQTSRRSETFGTGDVRGVIAVDAANNAKEGGALMTTIAFGVPGSVTMALLLSAFQIHGLVPGPLMLTSQLESTLTLVWGLVLANVIGAGLCFLLVAQIARVSLIKVHRIFPILMAVIFLGAFQARQGWGDLISLAAFGALGWVMKQAGWPRPPLILGFILGGMIQDNLFLSIQRYGAAWILEPIPLVLAVLCAISILYGVFFQGGLATRRWQAMPRLTWPLPVTLLFLAAAAFFIVEARGWGYQARLFPFAIGVPTMVFVLLQLARDLFSAPRPGLLPSEYSDVRAVAGEDVATVARGAGEAFAWIFGLLATIALVGFPPAALLFALFYLRFRSHESWPLAVAITAALMALVFLFFGHALRITWPQGLFTLF